MRNTAEGLLADSYTAPEERISEHASLAVTLLTKRKNSSIIYE
jgi:hypothetical protein